MILLFLFSSSISRAWFFNWISTRYCFFFFLKSLFSFSGVYYCSIFLKLSFFSIFEIDLFQFLFTVSLNLHELSWFSELFLNVWFFSWIKIYFLIASRILMLILSFYFPWNKSLFPSSWIWTFCLFVFLSFIFPLGLFSLRDVQVVKKQKQKKAKWKFCAFSGWERCCFEVYCRLWNSLDFTIFIYF